jgi:hypothetical protein
VDYNGNKGIMSRKIKQISHEQPKYEDIKTWVDARLMPESNPYNDQNVYENVYHKGKFVNIFQCVDESTRVTMGDGSLRFIRDIKIGDIVVSHSELLGSFIKSRVQCVYDNGIKDCIELLFSDNTTLICTPDHQIFTENKRWVEAASLCGDDLILPLSSCNHNVRLRSICQVGKRHVFDIEVNDTHNFIANGIVVHNCTSEGAQKFFMEAKPRSIINTACLTSVYRPGPLSAGADKLWIKHEHEHYDWGHPLINETLKETRGILVFQESVMALANKVAGFPLDQTDEVRRAIMKRSISGGEAAKQKAAELEDSFIAGAIKNSVPEETAKKAYQTILWMSGYGFNRTLHDNTLLNIYDKKGRFQQTKPISDVKPKEYLRSRVEKTKEDVYVKVIGLHDHGVLDLVEVTLTSGEKIQCTMDHKFRTIETGEMIPLYEIQSRGLSIQTSEHRPFVGYECKFCGRFIKKSGFNEEYSYEQHMIDCLSKMTEGVDYVECKLCKYAGKLLTEHVKNKHKLTRKEYESKYGKVCCDSSTAILTAKMKVTCNWISRANESGKDLTEYKKKMGKAVSESIMSDPEERKRRSDLMGSLNQREDARERARVTAIETSKRPEILAARSENLRKWRADNPDDFFEKCVKKMITTFHSKPELALQAILEEIEGYDFKYSQFLKDSTFTSKSKRKQVDSLDLERKFIVEFDGPHHFKLFKDTPEHRLALEATQKRDAALDAFVIREGWTLLRISCDEYSYKILDFSKPSMVLLFSLITDQRPGVFKIGASYHSNG